jgi:hypothetical protein
MKRFPGNIITQNKAIPTGPAKGGLAPGVWSMDSALQYIRQGKWPIQGLIPAGQQEYISPGTYTWVCPAEITNVSVVCVGAGGSNAGGGGELRYKNNISVTPGSSYTVTVGLATPFSFSSSTQSGFSEFINSSTCKAFGGNPGINSSFGAGGSGGAGDGGGNGGSSGLTNNLGAPSGAYSAGGGAGGYSGAGGNGNNNANGTDGAGGAGGGGSATNPASFGPSGGGVGIYGQGANGAGGIYNGAFNGGNGSPVVGLPSYFGSGSGYLGAPGAVRIIWGGNQVTRAFPSTNAQNYNV